MAKTVRLIGASQRAYAKLCAHCGGEFFRDTRNTYAYWERAKYCSSACSGLAQTARAILNRKPVAVEFWRWVNKSGDCWPWTGALDRDGYGIFSYGGRTYRASIVALQLDDRKPLKGMYACHRCDNPTCVRPDHLYPGTPAQNTADAIARGRIKVGSKHYAAKLTENAVRDIRSSALGDAEMASRYGVSKAAISMARSRKTWRSVA